MTVGLYGQTTAFDEDRKTWDEEDEENTTEALKRMQSK